MRILTMFGSTYCTFASLPFQICTSWRTTCTSVWQRKTFITAFVSRWHYLGTKIEAAGKK